MYYPFNEQRGAYKVLMRNRFIFVKNDLHPVMENIVLLHELGHDALQREEATKVGGFKEFEIFNMRDNRMEYEANLFAAQISLSGDDIIELDSTTDEIKMPPFRMASFLSPLISASRFNLLAQTRKRAHHQVDVFVFKFLNDVQIGFLRGSEKVRRS